MKTRVREEPWNLVNDIIIESLDKGLSTRKTIKLLDAVFPGAPKSQIETIARTELALALGASRFYALSERLLVVGIQFSCIEDDRCSDICRSRHGRIMLLDDPRVFENIPPLHFQCRSTILPVDRFDFEDLKSGHPEVTERFFGSEVGAKSLEEALNWNDVRKHKAPWIGKLSPWTRTGLC